MKIVFAADMAATAANEDLFINGDVEKITDNGILEYLAKFDFRVMNIEMALTETNDPIVKCGPNIKASKKAINAIKKFKQVFEFFLNHGWLNTPVLS